MVGLKRLAYASYIAYMWKLHSLITPHYITCPLIRLTYREETVLIVYVTRNGSIQGSVYKQIT